MTVASVILILGATTGACGRGCHIVRTLTPSQPIFSSIAGGEHHVYAAELSAGQYVSLVVEQRGIDLAVSLADPSGHRFLRTDRWTSIRGPEPAVFVTDTVGRYTIDVAPVRTDAPKGDYTIALAPPHAATAADRAEVARLHEAIAEYVRGQALNTQESQQSKVQALAAYERALARLPASAGSLWRATMLTLIGETHWDLGEFEEATTSKDEALELWREAGDADGEAETLYNRAVDFHHRGELDTAMEYAQVAQSRWIDAQNPRGEAIARSLIGRMHDTFGQFQAAIDDYLKALTAIEPLRDYSWQALITHNLGMVYFSLGEYGAARAQYQRAMDLAAEAHESPAHVLHHLGEVYLAMADYSHAAALLDRALKLDDDDLGRATTLLHLARLHAATGDAQGALEFAERALEKRRSAHYVLGEAQVHYTIGIIHQKNGALWPAEASLTRARDMSRAMHDTRLEAMALSALASIHEQSGSSASRRARDEALEAVALIEGLRVGVSNPELRTAYFATLHDAYEVAVDASMQLYVETGAALIRERRSRYTSAAAPAAYSTRLLRSATTYGRAFRRRCSTSVARSFTVCRRSLSSVCACRAHEISHGSTCWIGRMMPTPRSFGSSMTGLQASIRGTPHL